MVTVRLAEPADAPELARVRRRSWESAYRGIYPDERLDNFDYDAHAERFLKNMAEACKDVYILEDEVQAVGFLVISAPEQPLYKDFPVCLNALYLLPEYHRQGIGRRMIGFAADWCLQRGFDRFFLSCSLHNHRARAFYEAMGGVLGEVDDGNENPGADVCYYEFQVDPQRRMPYVQTTL